jgi:hypothetical protein
MSAMFCIVSVLKVGFQKMSWEQLIEENKKSPDKDPKSGETMFICKF